MSHHWLKPHWKPNLTLPELPINHLIERNIKAIILDVDKTIVDSKESSPNPPVSKWIIEAKQRFKLHLLSNNPSKNRIGSIGDQFELPYTYLAAKPSKIAINKVIKNLHLSPSNIAIIGDRIFTDILVGNRLGLYTVLIKALKSENPSKKYSKLQKIEQAIAYFLGA
tara:strand:- start:78 stop:578 length:501 start_codon:yes stop_codon:yes gene_type:complete